MQNTTRGFEKFAEILEKKIRKQIESEMQNATPTSEQTAQRTKQGPPDLLSQLLTSVNPVHFTTPSRAHKYPHKVVKPQPRPSHQFNPQQALSYQFFVKNGGRLADNFNRKELESAFRALALKLHPDQGGTAETFRKLLDARKVLSGLL